MRGRTREREQEAGAHEPMSYARNLLSRGEDVVYESRQHWFAVVARVFIWFLVLVVALQAYPSALWLRSAWQRSVDPALASPLPDPPATAAAAISPRL